MCHIVGDPRPHYFYAYVQTQRKWRKRLWVFDHACVSTLKALNRFQVRQMFRLLTEYTV